MSERQASTFKNGTYITIKVAGITIDIKAKSAIEAEARWWIARRNVDSFFDALIESDFHKKDGLP